MNTSNRRIEERARESEKDISFWCDDILLKRLQPPPGTAQKCPRTSNEIFAQNLSRWHNGKSQLVVGKRESESEREEEERVDEKEPTDSSHEFVKLRGFQFHRCRGSVCHGANVTGHFFDFFQKVVCLSFYDEEVGKER
jgi:hypothetical protein